MGTGFYTLDDARRDHPTWFDADEVFDTKLLRQWPLEHCVYLLSSQSSPAGPTHVVARLSATSANAVGPTGAGLGELPMALAVAELAIRLELEGRLIEGAGGGGPCGICMTNPDEDALVFMSTFEYQPMDSGWIGSCSMHLPHLLIEHERPVEFILTQKQVLQLVISYAAGQLVEIAGVDETVDYLTMLAVNITPKEEA